MSGCSHSGVDEDLDQPQKWKQQPLPNLWYLPTSPHLFEALTAVRASNFVFILLWYGQRCFSEGRWSDPARCSPLQDVHHVSTCWRANSIQSSRLHKHKHGKYRLTNVNVRNFPCVGLNTKWKVFMSVFVELWSADHPRFARWSAAASEEKELQKLYQTLKEWRYTDTCLC